ncbi:MAG: glycosyltransferase family 4 protein [Deltaproteobacteria bacterium]|nr:glycosyltransferase family 4 protein [Deltaproteobacteria bacterium]
MKPIVKILHTEWSRGWGGQEIRIIAECRAFIDKGYRMEIACKSGSRIMKAAKEHGITVHPFPFLSPLDVRTVLLLARFLKKHHVDLVHTHSSVDSWNASLAGRLAGVPVVRSRHLSAPISKSVFSRLLYMGLADRVITSGQVIKDRMIRKNRFNPARIVSVPAGVDERRFRPVSDAEPVRREFGLSPDDFVLGIVAILRSWKGHEILLEASKQLLGRIPNLKVMIVGDGPYRETLVNRTRDLGLESRVIFTGFRKDVPELLGAMNVFALPSTQNEATSQVIPQAMLAGVPAIASSAGGLAEVIDQGRTGFLVPPNDPKSLAEAVYSVFSRPEEAAGMAKAAREAALEKWTFSGMIGKTEAVYQSILDHR